MLENEKKEVEICRCLGNEIGNKEDERL